uniref:phosphoglycerate mutase n=1 Tax=Catenella fusiformis TaxID=3024791 RepID=UPI0027D9E12C|nr:phosphoglycerate mutase [Catenella fusiformis]WCH57472.1 phosphoglycerate mutase [Catenella fusiformis]
MLYFMQQKPFYPIVLTILDGWGYTKNVKGNAIALANTPTMDQLWDNYSHTLLSASGLDVGLPNNQMGNSEVGHTTIGGGRIINQDLVKISTSIENKTFFNNSVLHNICKITKINKSKLHLIGLCSNGGVHSHISHLIALIEMVQTYNIQTCIHIITDGRDTHPRSAELFIREVVKTTRNTNNINICTISGRYYSMDRDCRWSRTEKAYQVLIENTLSNITNPIKLLDESYNNNISDEFITPTRIYPGRICSSDGIIFFNFRPDRMRQLTHCFIKNSIKDFKTNSTINPNIVTFTEYDSNLKSSIVFPTHKKAHFLGEILSNQGLKQLRLAETEKYAHVTYFFNGGMEEPFPGEDRELISSPQVPTYDLAPEMSAYQLTNNAINAIKKNIYQFIVINYANPDMVGHTGNLEATIKAITIVDKCIDRLFKEIKLISGTLIITADHGNAEYMTNETGQPCTSHSTNVVPFILIQSNNQNQTKALKKQGSLADIAPTILELLNINPPNEMNGKSLLNK